MEPWVCDEDDDDDNGEEELEFEDDNNDEEEEEEEFDEVENEGTYSNADWVEFVKGNEDDNDGESVGGATVTIRGLLFLSIKILLNVSSALSDAIRNCCDTHSQRWFLLSNMRSIGHDISIAHCPSHL